MRLKDVAYGEPNEGSNWFNIVYDMYSHAVKVRRIAYVFARGMHSHTVFIRTRYVFARGEGATYCVCIHTQYVFARGQGGCAVWLPATAQLWGRGVESPACMPLSLMLDNSAAVGMRGGKRSAG